MVSGVVTRLLNHVRELSNAGDIVHIICPQANECLDVGVQVTGVKSFALPIYPDYRIGIPDRGLRSIVQRFDPDVIHFVSPFAFGFRCYDILAAETIAAPFVFSLHTLYAEYVKRYGILRPLSRALWWITKAYHNCADVNIAVSSVLRDDLIRRGFRNVHLWPLAVDTIRFRASARDDEMRMRMTGGEQHKSLLITVSRLAKEKNIAFLGKVLGEVPNSCLAIVGEGPERKTLERLFHHRPVRFLGTLRGDELASAFASADVFVFASETEGSGNVILEAMASECPVVAPRAWGISSLIEHGRTGMLYHPRNVAEAAHYVNAMIEDSSSITRAARQTVESWTWSIATAQIRSIYHTAIEECERRGIRPELDKRLAMYQMRLLVYAFRAWSAISKPCLKKGTL